MKPFLRCRPGRPTTQKSSPHRTAIPAAVLATVTVALLTAGCGGSRSSTGPAGAPDAGGSASAASAVAYSGCMRSHGVPQFPDPPATGLVPKGDAQHFGVSASVFHAAQTACAHLLPATGGAIQQCEESGICPQSVVQPALTLMRAFARCMRAHGQPQFPDPSIDPEGRPFFNVSAAGLSYDQAHSPSFQSDVAVCERQTGGAAGVPVPMG